MVHDLFLVKFFKLSSSVTFLLISVTTCTMVQLNLAVTKSSFFLFINSSPLHWQYLKLHWITPTQKGMLPLRLPSFFNSVGFKYETTKVVYIFLQNGNHCVHKILIHSSKWFPCKIFDFQSPANWKLYSFLIILQQKNPPFDTVEFVGTLTVSTDDPISNSCFCLIYLKMSLEIAIYIKFWYTFRFFFLLFYIITYYGSVITCSVLLRDLSATSDLLLVSLSLFLSIFFTCSLLELVKIIGLCLR